MSEPADGELTMQQAAAHLGVHYMTVYRYVRLGMLPAHKDGATWRVTEEALSDFSSGRGTGPVPQLPGARSSAPWGARLEARLLAGDGSGAWSVVEAALASGASVEQLYLDIITPAMVSVGERWAVEDIDIGDEHRASAVVLRLLARLGPRFARPGRYRGSVVLAGAPGEQHALPVSMLADLLTGEGYEVIELGADVPPSSLAHMAGSVQRLSAVGVSVTTPGLDDNVRRAVASLRKRVPSVPILIGGGGIRDKEHASSLGADCWAVDGRGALGVIEDLVGGSRP
ncbi:MAG: B12-binding domain-containing protein [Acidimicrobiales bacterium]